MFLTNQIYFAMILQNKSRYYIIVLARQWQSIFSNQKPSEGRESRFHQKEAMCRIWILSTATTPMLYDFDPM